MCDEEEAMSIDGEEVSYPLSEEEEISCQGYHGERSPSNEETPIIIDENMQGDQRCFTSLCENFHCTWKFDHFSSLDRTAGTLLESDPIPSVELESVYWSMNLYPGGDDSDCEATVRCCLICANAMPVPVRARVAFYMRNSKNDVIAGSPVPVMNLFVNGISSKRIETPRYNLLGQIEDDIVVIVAEIICTRSVWSFGITMRFLDEMSPYFFLGEDCSKIPFRMEGDVHIVVDGRTIHAHSAVLSARSKVFADMLEQDTVQSRTRRIEIVDFGYDLVKAMLVSIYTGAVHGLTVPLALGLLRIGDEYQLDGLIAQCMCFLVAQLHHSNVVEVVSLAHALRSCEKLRKEAIAYISFEVSADDFERDFAALKENNAVLYDTLRFMKDAQKNSKL